MVEMNHKANEATQPAEADGRGHVLLGGGGGARA